ncbi:hypothetical protein GZ77_24495 [Endozoicomonas montiporae]|uniref:Uncharacterized protein n=3 Tax=Endozoicomonas montiporae TaxID=1027273 RepID=A0A081MZQ4_9GAMM|nr:hypothetical protein GZ77_24495 [Endozoicomonas montiporae]
MGYPKTFKPTQLPGMETGQNSNGQKVELMTPTSVLTSPEAKETSVAPAERDGTGIRQRLACPLYTAGNYFVKTVFKTGKVGEFLAGLPALLVGGIASAAVSISVGAIVKLVESLAGTGTSYGQRILMLGPLVGAGLIATPVIKIGSFVGKLAGAGLGIVGSLVGFGRGVRDAFTGDLHRLEGDKPTLKGIFEQAKVAEQETRKIIMGGLRVPRKGEETTLASKLPTIDLEAPEAQLYDDYKKPDFSSLILELEKGYEASSDV